MSIKRIGLILLFITVIYVGWYQYLVNEGRGLIDEHCIKINPLIIARKEIYLDSMKSAFAGKYDDYLAKNEKYLEISKRYLKAERPWLEKYKAFIERWDTKLIFPKKVDKLNYYDYKIYELDYLGTDLIVKMLNEKNKKKNKLLGDMSETNTNELNRAYDEYGKISKTRDSLIQPLVNLFVRAPKSECPEKNWNIPNVMKELNKEAEKLNP